MSADAVDLLLTLGALLVAFGSALAVLLRHFAKEGGANMSRKQ